MTEKFNVVYQQYPTQILVSEERKNEYYNVKVDIVPDYIQRRIDLKEYYWGNDWQLYSWQPIEGRTHTLKMDKRLGAPKHLVIKNYQAAGTPKYEKISGQAFWVGGMEQAMLRVKIKNELTAFFAPQIGIQLPMKIYLPIKHYLQLEFIFFTPIVLSGVNMTQDINNHSYPYIKVFQDVLQKMKVIETDGPTQYRGDYYRYVEIDNYEERRLEIKFHICTNNQPIIK